MGRQWMNDIGQFRGNSRFNMLDQSRWDAGLSPQAVFIHILDKAPGSKTTGGSDDPAQLELVILVR